MQLKPHEAYLLELLHLSKVESYDKLERAVWVARKFSERYGAKYKKRVYNWALYQLCTLGEIPFPSLD